jgi:hypothetical protein
MQVFGNIALKMLHSLSYNVCVIWTMAHLEHTEKIRNTIAQR